MSRPDMAFDWAPDHPIDSRMTLVSGTDPARAANPLTAAFELYQGGCLPQLRARLGDWPQHRSRVRVLSAGHGVLHADAQLVPDLPMTEQRSKQLRPLVRDKLR